MTQSAVPAPSVKLTSFACPVCGAHATQTWFTAHLNRCEGESPVPHVLPLEEIERIEEKAKKSQDAKNRAVLEKYTKLFRRMLLGQPFYSHEKKSIYESSTLENVFVSLCYTCGEMAIWLHDRLLYPPTMTGPTPNPGLSQEVQQDYGEARKILDISPRGAAALLRLAIEKLCIELQAKGKDVNERIASLVATGLPVEVQQALDTVRVIGNEAVHPGQIDLRDDRETARKLFDLVNFIAEDRITRPKQIETLYGMIPEEKRRAIVTRDAKALTGKK